MGKSLEEIRAALDDADQRIVDALAARHHLIAEVIEAKSEDQASSANFYKVARYEVNGSYEGSAARLGNASVVQGVLVRVSNPAN